MNLKMNNTKTTSLYYIGMLFTIVAFTNFSLYWFLAALVVHFVVISLFSAVTHRYFCHRSYDANPFTAYILGVVPVLYGYSTPAGWASLHAAHHAYADTDKDTHLKGWKGLFTANYRMPPLKFATNAKWFYDKKHEILHRYAMLFVISYFVILGLISFNALLWLGAVPLFTLHFGNGLHRVFSHKGDKAQNRWYLEYIVPMGGEWIHDEHHINARKSIFKNKWYELDTGSFIVKLLKKYI